MLLTVPAVLLAGCGGPSEVDREICASAPAPDSWDGSAGRAGAILQDLAGYAPDNDRLVRAVDHARDDASAVVGGQDRAARLALTGSLSAIHDVCDDLGA
jgi:hypothetical protein